MLWARQKGPTITSVAAAAAETRAPSEFIYISPAPSRLEVTPNRSRNIIKAADSRVAVGFAYALSRNGFEITPARSLTERSLRGSN
jgi:hypothetical protein